MTTPVVHRSRPRLPGALSWPDRASAAPRAHGRAPEVDSSLPWSSSLAFTNLSGTVLRSRSGFYTVTTESGTYECQLRGRLKRERRSEDLVVPGDQVTLTPLNVGMASARA